MEQSATYIGPIEHLKGKRALVRRPPERDFLMVQFNDCCLTRKEVLASWEDSPDESLGIGWHAFRRSDFKVDYQ